MKQLNLGNSDFKSIIENNNYFIDKSLLIKDILTSQKAVLLFARPRRFGKTLNLSMLRYFLDKNTLENKELFKNLKIWQTNNDIKKHCCKYPIINISFKDAKAQTWKTCYGLIISEIVNLYKQHIYLLQSDVLYDFEKQEFDKILRKTADESVYQVSIKNLSEYLFRFHKQKVVILVDEYDAPIQSGYKNFYNEVVSFLRNLLSGAYKDNNYLFLGVITGILRISKESIFSGLNNLSVYSIADNKFSDKFGFTENEVLQIIKDFKVNTDFNLIKKWYNGYKIGNTESIYNPWSILNYVAEYEEGFKTYWTNTSANKLIINEISKKDSDIIRQEILKLINGETVAKDIEENFVFPDLKRKKSLLWTLLLFSGYLTIHKKIGRKEFELQIPNYEIKTIFQDTIIEWFETDIKIIKSVLLETTKHLINNRIKDFEVGFKQIIGDTFSYYDTSKTNEYIYHSYILGLLAIIGDDYIIKSNRESGEGRYDIMLIPHNKTKSGVVIEIKQIEKQQVNENEKAFFKRINHHIENAQKQINRNKYYKELIDNKIAHENIIKVPIIFAGKVPYITNINTKNKN